MNHSVSKKPSGFCLISHGSRFSVEDNFLGSSFTSRTAAFETARLLWWWRKRRTPGNYSYRKQPGRRVGKRLLLSLLCALNSSSYSACLYRLLYIPLSRSFLVYLVSWRLPHTSTPLSAGSRYSNNVPRGLLSGIHRLRSQVWKERFRRRKTVLTETDPIEHTVKR